MHWTKTIAACALALISGPFGAGRPSPIRPTSNSKQSRKLVEERRHLRDLPAQLSGLERRRHRRSERHHPAPRLPEGPGRRRHLAFAHLSVAAGRLRLRHLRLRKHRSAVRHAGGLRPPGGRGEKAQYPHHHGHGDEPHLRQAQVVPRVALFARPIPTATGMCGTTARVKPPTDKGEPPNNWQSDFGHSAWEWDPKTRQY